jgi:hypothetical protein
MSAALSVTILKANNLSQGFGSTGDCTVLMGEPDCLVQDWGSHL